MNKKQWTGLLMIYISYLLLGATIFYYIEIQAEIDYRETIYNDYVYLTELIKGKFGNQSSSESQNFTAKLTEYCGKTFELDRTKDQVIPPLWNFYNSFFFVVTVVSTIGYGNLHPTTDFGRVLMILYAIIGIPLNGILLSSLGQFFGAVFHRAHRKYKTHRRYGARCALAVNILTYLTPGLIIFIFLPAGLFCYFETEWDYIDGVYFAFVTLTTIGFGDLVAGQTDANEDGAALMTYKVLIIFWVIFGLGYLIMLLGFVAQAMQAKKIVRLEEKLMASLTHSRIWHGFSKDISYMRRLINELYLDKLKPVFRDEKVHTPPIIHRSKSLPDIFSCTESEAINQRRRARAMSEHHANKISLTRVFSETDLQRIDKKATFAAASTVPTTFELMRRVIDVYTGGQMREWHSADEATDGLRGVDGFSDEEVLSTEGWYDRQATITAPASRHPSSLFNVPSYEDTVSRVPHRGRAMSECPPTDLKNSGPSINPEGAVDWTWSGPNANKLHDIIKHRNKQRMVMGLNKGRKSSLSSTVIAGAKKINPLRRRRRCVTESNSNEDGINNIHNGNLIHQKHALSVPDDMGAKRHSLQENKIPIPDKRDKVYMTTTATDLNNDLHKLYSRGDRLFGSGGTHNELLEETSLADFLRVLTNLHSRVGEHLIAAENQTKPRRKMGTASLTPPRIRSLLELFPDPTVQGSPKPPKKRKPSKITNLFRADSRREGMANVQSASDDAQDKSPEPSNLKRLGRFLLRSYSIVPKDNDDSTRLPYRRKRFSLWPTDSDDRTNPPFQLHVDSPSVASTEISITIEPDEPRRDSAPSNNAPGLLFPPSETVTQSPKSTDTVVSQNLTPRRNSNFLLFVDNPLSDEEENSRKPL